MAAKINRQRHGTKLRHCQPMWAYKRNVCCRAKKKSPRHLRRGRLRQGYLLQVGSRRNTAGRKCRRFAGREEAMRHPSGRAAARGGVRLYGIYVTGARAGGRAAA